LCVAPRSSVNQKLLIGNVAFHQIPPYKAKLAMAVRGKNKHYCLRDIHAQHGAAWAARSGSPALWMQFRMRRDRARLVGGNCAAYRATVGNRPLAIAAVLALSCLSHSISDGVSILGAREIAGFGLGKRFEAEAEPLAPPVFESAMFVSQFAELLRLTSRSADEFGQFAASAVRPAGCVARASARDLLLQVHAKSKTCLLMVGFLNRTARNFPL
jgi:hypothetical protein